MPYRNSEKRKAYCKKYSKWYSKTPARRAYQAKRRKSPEHRAYMKAYHKKWNKSEAQRRYEKSPSRQMYYRLRRMNASYREYQRQYNISVTARTRAIAESLVTLFPLLPDIRWREQFAKEIFDSNSGQTLCWVNSNLEDLIVEHTGEI